MRKLVSYSLVLGLVFACQGSVARATVVGADDFSTNGALLGTNADVGGTWTITGTSVVNPLTVTGNALAINTTGQDAYAAFSAPVPTTAGTAIYSGLDITLTSAQATGDYFFHLSDPAGTTSNFYNRLFARSSGSGFQLGLSATSGTATYGTDVLTLGTTYRVVVAWNFVAGAANDTFSLYVNPVSTVEGNNTPYMTLATWGGAEPAANVSAMNFRQGTAANAPVLAADNLIVATTFAAAVPEASSFILGGLVAGVMGLGYAGRRLRRPRA